MLCNILIITRFLKIRAEGIQGMIPFEDIH